MKKEINNTLTEYIEYYKDFTFKDREFNVVDATILGYISYQPCAKIKDGATLDELYEKCIGLDKEDIHGLMGYISIDILKAMKDTKRYKDILVYDIKKKIDFDVQFGALTFRWNNVAYVSFEGSSASMAGWVENFNLYAEYPTMTQKLAISYLNDVIKDTDEVIYVGGHSKGGNCAMVSSMEAVDSIFDRIKTIYNLDGPGFREEEFKTDKFKKMNKKCLNILPDGSMVGILMNNENYNFIKANESGVKKHYPFNWVVYGEFLAKGEQDKFSKGMQQQLCTNLDKVDMNDYKKLLKVFKKFFKDNNLVTSHDFDDLTFVKLKKMFDDVKDVDPETRKRFFEMIKVILIRG